MRNYLAVFVCAVAMLGAAPAMTGCAVFENSHPTQQVRDIGAVYLGVVNTLNAARMSGEIDDDAWHNEINPVIQEGRAIYNDLADASLADDADRTDMLEAALRGIVARLSTYTEGN